MKARTTVSTARHLAAAVLLSCAAAGAQTPPVPQPPRFSTSVDVVSVDVNVIDRNARPVRDLDAADFTITVEGRARKIVSAQFISVTAPAAAPEPPATDYTTNTGLPNGRLIAVVVDRGSIAPVRAKDVFASAARFVERLQPSDRVALYSIPSGTAIDFTTDHDAVEAALHRMDGRADSGPATKSIGVAEAIQFERGNSVTIEDVTSRECGNMSAAGQGSTSGGRGDTMICRAMVKEQAATMAAYAHERARNTLTGLFNLLGHLGTGETPKTIVLVSEGLVIDGDRFAAANLARAVAAAHATIYVLKPEPSDSDASQQRVPQERARDRAILEEGLTAMARIGGGDLFRIVADPDFAFARLDSELSGYYLLGFEPEAADRDGKSHAISVKVRRDDVSIRSRLEFNLGPAGKRSALDTIAELLRAPTVATELPFRLTTYAFQDPESPKIRLLVAMEVERAADANAKMAMGIVLIKPGGDVGANFFQPEIAAPAKSTSAPQRSFTTLLIEPGPYTLRAAVVDSDGRRGSVERPVRAFMTRMGPFRATQALIGDQTQGQGEGAAIVPTITGDLAGDQLHMYFELFADDPRAFEGAAVAVDIMAAGGANPVESAPVSLLPTGADPHCRAATGSLSLGLLSPGAYVARAVVSLGGRNVGQVTRPFRVVKR